MKHPPDKHPLTGRLKRENTTVRVMITMYCHNHHKTSGTLCNECSSLSIYAEKKVSVCPFKENKPDCASCHIHCYRAVEREQIRKIMRYSGPRMILRHPYLAVMHIIDKVRYKKRR